MGKGSLGERRAPNLPAFRACGQGSTQQSGAILPSWPSKEFCWVLSFPAHLVLAAQWTPLFSGGFGDVHQAFTLSCVPASPHSVPSCSSSAPSRRCGSARTQWKGPSFRWSEKFLGIPSPVREGGHQGSISPSSCSCKPDFAGVPVFAGGHVKYGSSHGDVRQGRLPGGFWDRHSLPEKRQELSKLKAFCCPAFLPSSVVVMPGAMVTVFCGQ